MGWHPINLAARFILELAALGAMGVWGWTRGEGPLRFVLAVGLPVIAAALWGIFRVPNDPGAAPVAVPGPVRLALELAFFGFAAWGLYQAGFARVGLLFGVIVAGHYLLSYDRLGWLLRQ